MRDRSSGRSGVTALATAALAAAVLTACAYWPGLMTWDAVRQYGEALSGDIDDWHPPTMQWIWREIIWVYPGPAPMLLLQLALYWGGIATLAFAFWHRQKGRLAWTLLACGLLPLGLALTGVILKDCLLTGVLLCVVGLLVHREHRATHWSAVIIVGLLCLAATLRFNAFLACLPLMIALLPRSMWCTWPRLLLTASLAAPALLAMMPIANWLIGAKPSGVELSLVLFDLGGITEHSGTSVFPNELEVSDPVGVNRLCYRPDKWDGYSDWVAPECPLGLTAWHDNVDAAQRPVTVWIGAIVAHPIAYAEHRLHHFAINTRLVPLSDEIERPVPDQDAPNDWGFSVPSNPIRRGIDTLTMATAHTPLGWPIVWIGVALGALVASWRLPHARVVAPIALSSILYGCGYLVFSVASELRYHLWTELAALIALVLASGLGPRRRLGLAFAPGVIASAVGIGFRLLS